MLERLGQASRMQAAAEQTQPVAGEQIPDAQASGAQVVTEQIQPGAAQSDEGQNHPDSAPAAQVPTLNIVGQWGRLKISGSGGPHGTPSQSVVTLTIANGSGGTNISGSGDGLWGLLKISSEEIMVGILPADPAPTQEVATQTDKEENDQIPTYSPEIQAQSGEKQADQEEPASPFAMQAPAVQDEGEKRPIRKLVTLTIFDEVEFERWFTSKGVLLELCTPERVLIATVGSPDQNAVDQNSVDQNDQDQSSQIHPMARPAFEENPETEHEEEEQVKRTPLISFDIEHNE